MKSKKLLSLFFFLLFTISYSQNKLSFSTAQNTSKFKNELSKNFKSYKILKLKNSTQKMAKSDQISISYGQDYNYTLKENKILANDYVVSIKGENGLEHKPLSELGFTGKYYTNTDISADNQLVLSTFENQNSIYIKNATADFYIEPLKKFNKNAASSDYILYNTKDIIAEKGTCGEQKLVNNSQNNKTNKTAKQTVGGCKTIELACL